LHERGRDEVGGGAAIDENDCGFAGDGTLQLEEATAGGGDLVTFIPATAVAAAEKTERRRRGRHPVWTVCSTAVARAMVVTAVVVVTVVGRVVLQAVGLLVVTELGRPQRNR
jgi:hypothetical protein